MKRSAISTPHATIHIGVEWANCEVYAKFMSDELWDCIVNNVAPRMTCIVSVQPRGDIGAVTVHSINHVAVETDCVREIVSLLVLNLRDNAFSLCEGHV